MPDLKGKHKCISVCEVASICFVLFFYVRPSEHHLQKITKQELFAPLLSSFDFMAFVCYFIFIKIPKEGETFYAGRPTLKIHILTQKLKLPF